MSVAASIAVTIFPSIEPPTANFPSGVTYTLCTSPFTGMVFLQRQRLGRDHIHRARSLANADEHAAPVARDCKVVRMPAEREPCRAAFPVLVSVAHSVLSASQVMYARVPSGENATPCAASMSFTCRTILLVAGSMMSTVSPALLV